MSLYGGVDLHANNNVIVLRNEQDEVIYQKRLLNALPTILEQLAPYNTEVKGLVVESTYNWYLLVDGLMEADYRVHLANPAPQAGSAGSEARDSNGPARPRATASSGATGSLGTRPGACAPCAACASVGSRCAAPLHSDC